MCGWSSWGSRDWWLPGQQKCTRWMTVVNTQFSVWLWFLWHQCSLSKKAKTRKSLFCVTSLRMRSVRFWNLWLTNQVYCKSKYNTTAARIQHNSNTHTTQQQHAYNTTAARCPWCVCGVEECCVASWWMRLKLLKMSTENSSIQVSVGFNVRSTVDIF